MDTSIDVERGLGDEGPSHARHAVLATQSPATQLREKHDLQVFQTLVGVHFLEAGGGHLPDDKKPPKPANPFLDIFLPSRTGSNRFRNRGLYDRALSQDLKNRVMYSMTHYVISFLYVLQIILAATFTALSAYRNSSTVSLTVLGALNTVLAGLLAWLTGQGMPFRFRRARDQYRELVKEIEATERMFAEIDYIRWPEGKRPHPIGERDRLERVYEQARIDQEANYPETQNTPAAATATQHSKELEEKVGKKKEAKSTAEKELDRLRSELKALKGEV